MIFYFKLGKVRGLSIELGSHLGFKPVYKKTKYRCEMVVDVPYIQCIYTPGDWTPIGKKTETLNKDVANDDTRTVKKAQEI